jgi:hypothetical protein
MLASIVVATATNYISGVPTGKYKSIMGGGIYGWIPPPY